MPVPILIVLVCLIGCDLLLTVLLFVQQRRYTKLITCSQTVVGVVEIIKEYRNVNGVFLSFWVHYTVESTSYRHKFVSRLGQYRDGQEIELVYLKDRPKFVCIRDEFLLSAPKRCRALMIGLNLIFLFTGILLLGDSYIRKGVPLEILEIGALWYFYVSEYQLEHKGISAQGTVVYAEQRKNRQIVIAEYTADSKRYETRPMKLSMKRCQKTYAVGDPVAVKYLEKRPDSAMIAEDIRNLKAAKVFLILLSICAIAMAVIDFLPF